jgi:hypothetical protein
MQMKKLIHKINNLRHDRVGSKDLANMEKLHMKN